MRVTDIVSRHAAAGMKRSIRLPNVASSRLDGDALNACFSKRFTTTDAPLVNKNAAASVHPAIKHLQCPAHLPQLNCVLCTRTPSPPRNVSPRTTSVITLPVAQGYRLSRTCHPRIISVLPSRKNWPNSISKRRRNLRFCADRQRSIGCTKGQSWLLNTPYPSPVRSKHDSFYSSHMLTETS